MNKCPINFDPYDLSYADDVFNLYKMLRENNPCYWNEKYKFWVVSQYDDVIALLKDYKTFTANYGITLPTRVNYDSNPDNRFFLERKDPPEHSEDRRVLNRALSYLIDEELHIKINNNIKNYFLKYSNYNNFDIVSSIFKIYPFQTICEMIGINMEDSEYIQREADNLFNLSPKHIQDESLKKIAIYLYKNPPLNMDKLRNIKVKNKKILDDEIIKFSIILLIAGYHTVTNALTNLLIDMDDNRDQFEYIISNPKYINNAVEESLRMRRVAQMVLRTATKDLILHGKNIKEGDSVMFMLGAANSDPVHRGDDADNFSIFRDTGYHNLTFSYGPHHCPGADLAREQLVAFLKELLNYKNFEIISKEKNTESNLAGSMWTNVHINLNSKV